MMVKATLVTLGVLVAAARAEGSVGVVVTGDATLQPAITAEIATWMKQRGHRVDAAALPAEAVTRLVDCFVLEDTTCARRLVAENAQTDAVVYARIDASTSGGDRHVTLALYWVTKDRDPTTQTSECAACSTDALKIMTGAMLSSLRGSASSTAAAPAAAPAPAETTTISASAPLPSSRPQGLAIGAELGEPSSATVGFFTGSFALLAAIGTGTREGVGIQLHADVQAVVHRLRPDVPLRVGVGGRMYHHGYERMSIDELADTHYGIRASAAIAKESERLQLYAELAPGVDLKRTNSCALTNGAYSVCPHAQENPFFFQFVVGARWFLSR